MCRSNVLEFQGRDASSLSDLALNFKARRPDNLD
jgi:hypothetical protein